MDLFPFRDTADIFSPSTLSPLEEDPGKVFSQIVADYPEVFRQELRMQSCPPKHGVVHHIETTSRPIRHRPRRLPPEKLALAKKEFHEMERMGVCFRGSSPWAAPLLMVPKPGRPGEWRPCGDYRTLNAITTPDAYAMPRVDEVVSALQGATIFTKCDLLKGYFQVPIRTEDIPKTAIATPFGTFLFRYSTFGLKNSGASFQRMMDNIFADVPFCRIYVDDIIIFSRTCEKSWSFFEETVWCAARTSAGMPSTPSSFWVIQCRPTVSAL